MTLQRKQSPTRGFLLSKHTGCNPPGVYSACFKSLLLQVNVLFTVITTKAAEARIQNPNQFPSGLEPPFVALAFTFDLPDERNEKCLMRRREKLPDVLRPPAEAAAKLLPMLEMSSCDWLRQASFCLRLLRKRSFDPLWRNPTKGRKTKKPFRVFQVPFSCDFT